MSKIGKINITIPEKVKAVMSGNVLNIEGPLGKKSVNVDLEMFILPILDNKIPYKLFLRQHVFFLHQHLS